VTDYPISVDINDSVLSVKTVTFDVGSYAYPRLEFAIEPNAVLFTFVQAGITIERRAQQTEVGAYVELFSLDATPLGGIIHYWTPSRPSSAVPIIWRGNTYTSVDVQVEGFEKTTAGAMPRPRISIGNADNVVGALLTVYGDLLGCTVTRTKTLYEFLDDQPGADPEQYWPLDIYKVERKVSVTKSMAVMELSTALDNASAKLPRDALIRDVCPLIYRRYSGGAFEYTKATCPYADTNYFDRTGIGTTMAKDCCGKKLSDCRKRFGDNEEIPFGGFPGLGRT